MRRWASDPYEIPGGVWNDIQKLLLVRVVTIDKLRNEIIRAIPDAPTSIMENRQVMPTESDRQVFFWSCLSTSSRSGSTSGNVDRG